MGHSALPSSIESNTSLRSFWFSAIIVSCVAPLIFVHIDCLTVLKGVWKGRKWCCAARRPHADIWRRIWDRLEDIGIGPTGIVLEKVAAHVSKATESVMSSGVLLHITASELADEYAKGGAHLGRNDFPHSSTWWNSHHLRESILPCGDGQGRLRHLGLVPSS